MKKILIATTALIATAGIAAAQTTVTGSGQMGLIYKADGDKKVTVNQEITITFGMSGETDSGLQFGAELPVLAGDSGSLENDGSSVYISGAFGTLTFGSVGEADEVKGLADLGLDGIGTDNVAEMFSGDSTGKILDYAAAGAGLDADEKAAVKGVIGVGHNVNYTISMDALTFTASALVGADNESAAVGVKYTFGDAYVGLGYNASDFKAVTALVQGYDPDVESLKSTAVSVYAGGTFDAITVNAMYTDYTAKAGYAGDTYKVTGDAFGLIASYKMDAVTMTAAYSKAKLDGVSTDAYGIGAAYDLGGSATLKGAIGRVSDQTVADFGVSMKF